MTPFPKARGVRTEPEVLRSVDEMRSYRTGRELGESLGFVPTLGYLHEGHLSLLRKAREECSAVALSIFVNPLQFGPDEDLDRYPRDADRDLRLAGEEGVDVVFIPEAGELYPDAFTTEVRVPDLENLLEGAARPGHFAGVATVLAKLLNIVGPDKMYLGQKDAQQALLVRRMMQDLNFPADLTVCPTVREPDGLAMSSRNAYLEPDERAAAAAIPRALFAARESGSREARVLEESVRQALAREPLVELEYVAATDASSLDPVVAETGEILLSLAARVGGTRLIDNVVLKR